MILVGNYFNTIARYPDDVKDLSSYQADLTLHADNIRSALLPTDSSRIAALIQSVLRYESALVFPDSVSEELINLEGYIRDYYLLAPNGFDIYKTLKNTTESIVGIFGFKGVASAILPDIHSEASSFKKRKIHAHFTGQSKTLLQSVTVLKAYIDQHIIEEINRVENQINEDVQLLFKREQGGITPLDYYFQYNQYFTDFYQRINNIRKLAQRISASLGHILITEAEIQKMTSIRQKIRRDSRKLHQLADDVRRIRQIKDELKLNNLNRRLRLTY